MSMTPHPCDSAPGVATPDPTSVYRYYDRSDILIYVGITRQGMGRNVQHNGKAEWWPFVARQEVEHYPDRLAAMAREKALIRHHRPPFNKQHNLDHMATRAAYLAFTSDPVRRESPNGMFHRLRKRLPLELFHHEGTELVLRSQLEHAPLAAAIRLEKEVVSVRGCMKYGTVRSFELHGPFALFTCQLRQKRSDIEFESARALLGWAQNVKPQYPWIRQVNVSEASR